MANEWYYNKRKSIVMKKTLVQKNAKKTYQMHSISTKNQQKNKQTVN